jgi:hypothetical protein
MPQVFLIAQKLGWRLSAHIVGFVTGIICFILFQYLFLYFIYICFFLSANRKFIVCSCMEANER